MYVSVTDAKAQLTDLVRRAEAGEEIVLTRHGQAAVRLAPVQLRVAVTDRRRLMEDVRMAARAGADVPAARSQDFLYGEDGLPA